MKYDEFTQAYIECALWSTPDPTDTGDTPRPADVRFDSSNMPPALLADMAADCKEFQEDNADLLAEIDDSQAGQDFWLTREGHGAGFWDRGHADDIGDKLMAAAKAYGNGSDAFYNHDWNEE